MGNAYCFDELTAGQAVRLEQERRAARAARLARGSSSGSSLFNTRTIGAQLRRLLPVPDVIQRTDYTCGPACLRATLEMYGLGSPDEMAIAKIAKTTSADGTTPENLAEAARYYGLEAQVRQGMSIADLSQYVHAGVAVIVDYQAWRDAPSNTPWATHWGDGHYSVVMDVDRTFVTLQDPWIIGRCEKIPHHEFLERWHGGENVPEERFMNGGVVVRPPRGFRRP